MKHMSRRDALRGVVAAAGVATLGSIGEAQHTEMEPLAFAGKHQAIPLPFNPASLHGISEKLIRSHHENNYTGAANAKMLLAIYERARAAAGRANSG